MKVTLSVILVLVYLFTLRTYTNEIEHGLLTGRENPPRTTYRTQEGSETSIAPDYHTAKTISISLGCGVYLHAELCGWRSIVRQLYY